MLMGGHWEEFFIFYNEPTISQIIHAVDPKGLIYCFMFFYLYTVLSLNIHCL